MRGGNLARVGLQQAVLALQPQNCSLQLVAASASATTATENSKSSFKSSARCRTARRAAAGAGAAATLLLWGTAGAAVAAVLAEDNHTEQQQQQQQQAPWLQQQQQQQQVPWQQQLLQDNLQHFTAAADAAQQQQQQQQAAWSSAAGGPSGPLGQSEPLSGAIPLLDDQGLTNHPLDYNPITNEHTAAMTLAKQSGIEAYQAGRYAEAERRFKEALVEARAGFPPDDPHIPSALHYLAEFYRNVGQLDKAEPLYRETLTQLGDTLGERHWMYSAALCSLAALHEARGEYTQAIELLESALELRRQLFSSSSFLYADTAALLAKTLMQQHTAAAAETTATSSNSSSGSGSSSWYRKLLGSSSSSSSSSSGPADVLRAIDLWQQAIQIVEDSGAVAHSPIISWLLDLAEAQQAAGQPAAAVVSLQKALEYMALPQQQDSSSNGSTALEQQQQQAQTQPQQQPGQASMHTSSSSSSSSVDGGGEDALTAALTAAGGNMEVARLKLTAMASDVAERLVNAQLAAGDLEGARATLRQALEARIALLGRHLVVAKTMTRLSNLLMQPPMDPTAPQLAPQFAASAVAIADAALQTAQRASLWRGVVRGALKAVQTASLGGYKAGLEAGRTCDRLLAALQLGNASLALAAAEKMNGRLPEAESALRHGVTELRWVLVAGGNDLERLSSSSVEPGMLQRVGGLLVDLKLLQMDCLEALAATLREQAAAAAAGAATGKQKSAAGKKQTKSAAAAAVAAAGSGVVSADDLPEVVLLLGEAELLAADLVADDDK